MDEISENASSNSLWILKSRSVPRLSIKVGIDRIFVVVAGEQPGKCLQLGKGIIFAYSFFMYLHVGKLEHPKNSDPACLPCFAILMTRGLPHFGQIMLLE